jgi:hypothetical protein
MKNAKGAYLFAFFYALRTASIVALVILSDRKRLCKDFSYLVNRILIGRSNRNNSVTLSGFRFR